MAEEYKSDLGEGGFDTINFGLTWRERTAIDHCFINKPEAIENYGTVNTLHYSDHKMIYIEMLTNTARKKQESVIVRDMRKIRANPQYFKNCLRKREWVKMANMVWSVDEMVKFYTNTITESLDEVAPFVERKFKPKKYCLPMEVKNEVKKRNHLFEDVKVAKKALKEHKNTH